VAVVTRKRQHQTTYYVTFSADGRKVWERSGTDKQEAKRLNRRRLAEVSDGTYQPKSTEEHPTVRGYATEWLTRRTCRWREDEEMYMRDYVLSREWFASMLLEDLAPKHMVRLVAELKLTWSERFKRTIAEHTVVNIYGIVRTMVRDARIAEIIQTDPCVLPKGTLRRRTPQNRRRKAYGVDDVRKVLACADLHPTARMFAAIAFLTGMREGEICGRRWRDIGAAAPLACLTVDTQYDGQPLKSDKDDVGEHARRVPIHPELARVLGWWQVEGFALVHLRPPTPDDFIVPAEGGKCFGRSAAYSMWRRALAKAGVENLSLHSTRHTFITLARRGGARPDVLERVTHNAAGATIDIYTHWEWVPLCEAALCLSLDVGDAGGDVSAKVPFTERKILVAPPGLEPGKTNETVRSEPVLPEDTKPPESSAKQAVLRDRGPKGAARHQLAPWVSEATANLLELRLARLNRSPEAGGVT
jgi:integrase